MAPTPTPYPMRCLARLTTVLPLLAVLTSPLSAQHADSSGAPFTIHVDSLDRAAFANIPELLQARVPGLHIIRTGDGGMRWYMRGPASVWEASPLVILDDVRMTVAGSSTPELGTRPVALEDINLEEVERIEVWSGAATSARFGPGWGGGVGRELSGAECPLSGRSHDHSGFARGAGDAQ